MANPGLPGKKWPLKWWERWGEWGRDLTNMFLYICFISLSLMYWTFWWLLFHFISNCCKIITS